MAMPLVSTSEVSRRPSDAREKGEQAPLRMDCAFAENV